MPALTCHCCPSHVYRSDKSRARPAVQRRCLPLMCTLLQHQTHRLLQSSFAEWPCRSRCRAGQQSGGVRAHAGEPQVESAGKLESAGDKQQHAYRDSLFEGRDWQVNQCVAVILKWGRGQKSARCQDTLNGTDRSTTLPAYPQHPDCQGCSRFSKTIGQFYYYWQGARAGSFTLFAAGTPADSESAAGMADAGAGSAPHRVFPLHGVSPTGFPLHQVHGLQRLAPAPSSGFLIAVPHWAPVLTALCRARVKV